MPKFLILILFILFLEEAKAENKSKIIENLKNTFNMSFEFEQDINGKIENGNCLIKYPKKIYCKYKKNNKILISNGKSLVIKTNTSYYRYPLEKTPLNLILDKDFLIKKIKLLNENIITNNSISYRIAEKDSEIILFFDGKTFDLIGWENKDIYQNYNTTFISSIIKNKKLESNLFEVPSPN